MLMRSYPTPPYFHLILFIDRLKFDFIFKSLENFIKEIFYVKILIAIMP